MFSLENELKKRLDIIAERNVLLDKKINLEAELELVNEEIGKHNYEELENEVAEIKRLMGIEEPVEDVHEEIVGE